jgi:hypothetical protein
LAHFRRTLISLVKVETNGSCETHEDVSLARPWPQVDIQRISKALLWFEPSIQAIVPSHRRNNQYCKSFMSNNPAFQGISIHQCLKIIDQKANQIEVANLMDSDRYHAVNFLNLYYGRPGTVESRMAPASEGPRDVLAWVEFATVFTLASILVGRRLTQYARNVGGLRLFLQRGDIEGVTIPDLRSPIFGELSNLNRK